MYNWLKLLQSSLYAVNTLHFLPGAHCKSSPGKRVNEVFNWETAAEGLVLKSVVIFHCNLFSNLNISHIAAARINNFHFIHPFSIPTQSNSGSQWRGVELFPAPTEREAGYALDGLPLHHRTTQRQTRPHACVLTCISGFNLESPVNLTCMFLDSGRELEIFLKFWSWILKYSLCLLCFQFGQCLVCLQQVSAKNYNRITNLAEKTNGISTLKWLKVQVGYEQLE